MEYFDVGTILTTIYFINIIVYNVFTQSINVG